MAHGFLQQRRNNGEQHLARGAAEEASYMSKNESWPTPEATTSIGCVAPGEFLVMMIIDVG
jgi:hypothetical protein